MNFPFILGSLLFLMSVAMLGFTLSVGLYSPSSPGYRIVLAGAAAWQIMLLRQLWPAVVSARRKKKGR